MSEDRKPELRPWVVVHPGGVGWLGHASDERHAWDIALGWPSEAEVKHHKSLGWYAAPATVTWTAPNGHPRNAP